MSDLLDRLPLPSRLPPSELTTEYNRGRVIGNLERVLLVATVAGESYEAMGFIIAAKGLIRISVRSPTSKSEGVTGPAGR